MPRTDLSQPPPLISKFGEELPVFCESCGYSLHGAVQLRCPQCDILHFQCPECGHHQPINTLRPLVQRFLGRGRATNLIAWVLLKLLFFGLTLWAWGVMGYAFVNDELCFAPHSQEFVAMMWGAAIYGFFFAAVGRMLLLRWQRGWGVGLVLAMAPAGAAWAGAHLASIGVHPPTPYWGHHWQALLCCIGGIVMASSTCAWVLWLLAVWLLLPRRIGSALLEWQRSMSKPQTPPDAPALFK